MARATELSVEFVHEYVAPETNVAVPSADPSGFVIVMVGVVKPAIVNSTMVVVSVYTTGDAIVFIVLDVVTLTVFAVYAARLPSFNTKLADPAPIVMDEVLKKTYLFV